MASLGHRWGVSAEECALPFPCDGNGAPFHHDLFRGITVRAAPRTLFRWLCQMKVAPYSYDWIDNFGRPSPQRLTPGLEHLELGQTFMSIFRLEAFEPDRFVTLRLRNRRGKSRFFEDLVVCYAIFPHDPRSCRLLAKLRVRYAKGISGTCARAILPMGDLIMMRRQLLNLARLAEASQSSAPAETGH